LFDRIGNLVAESKSELAIEQPQQGWAEQSPETVWNFTKENVKAVVSRKSVKRENIAAVGITGHMHGTFLLNKSGSLARDKAIVWIDTRAADILRRFRKDGTADTIFEISGWNVITSMQLLHLKWLSENEPHVLANTKYFLACKDYLRYRLTGQVLSDVTDASFTGLFNNAKREWSEEAFGLAGVDSSIAPPLKNPWERGGSITEDVSKETGLKAGTPVAVGSGDVASMALGAGITEKNQLLANIGAAGVYERPVESPLYDRKRRVYQIALHAIPGKWLLQANQMSAALSLRWFRDNILSGQMSYKELDELAAKSNPGARGVIYHPFLQGERSPFVNPNAKGLFFGLTLKTDLKDLIRAVLEGVAMACKDNLNSLTANADGEEFEVTMSGGAAQSDLWCKIVADVTGYRVRIVRTSEVGALGAAILATLCSGLYSDYKQAVGQLVNTEKKLEPDPNISKKYGAIFDVYRNLYQALPSFYTQA
jgi:xylulokinase